MIRSSNENVLRIVTGFKHCNEPNNKLFYGVELEVDVGLGPSRRKVSEACLSDFKNDVILKEESSVPSGFEIVTIPATLNYHRTILWNDFFLNSATKVHSTNRCGLHIHFSREALTEKQLAKTIFFIHETANSGFLSKIAGRRVFAEARWCMQRKKYYGQFSSADIISQESHTRTAISVSGRNGGKSVELRIFASNATKQGVMQALEFTDALIQYCGVCADTEEALGYKAFIKWFNENNKKEEYSYLYNRLIKESIVERIRGWMVLMQHRKAS